jgi:leucyl aminopeptidase
MKFAATTDSLLTVSADALIIPVFEDEAATGDALGTLDEATGGLLSSIVGGDEMKGKPGQTAYLHGARGVAAKRILLIGFGKPETVTAGAVRTAVGTAVRTAGGRGAHSFALWRRGAVDARSFGRAAAEGALIGAFTADAYKTEDRDELRVESLTLAVDAASVGETEAGLERGRIVGEAVNFTRTLVNEPSNTMTPTWMAHHAQEMAAQLGLSAELLDENKMRDLEMGALLSVTRGSDEEPRMIVLRYQAPNATSATDTVALIGKGITFDTGGISLKPAENMEKMKYDMAGGAAVLGAMRALAQLKPNVNVIGIVPACENMPSGKATKPGDIVKSMLGKTIEIINTDAEGRLILCDAIAYARRLGATKIIDLATLTGAIGVALGTIYCGLFASDQNLADKTLAAAKAADEKIWQLPLDKEYRELIKSDIADLKNTGGRYGGSITAAYFLREFVGDVPWVHLDIAGVAWNGEKKGHLAKGPSGFGVRTLVEYVSGLA